MARNPNVPGVMQLGLLARTPHTKLAASALATHQERLTILRTIIFIKGNTPMLARPRCSSTLNVRIVPRL